MALKYEIGVFLVTVLVLHVCVAFPTTPRKDGEDSTTSTDDDKEKSPSQEDIAFGNQQNKKADSKNEKQSNVPGGRTEPAQAESAPPALLDPRANEIDYYDYIAQPRILPDEEAPVLPDQVTNVNEDYAGIYDYRGQHDGRFRRKRTLTTNLEQLLTRSSRVSRNKRSVNSVDGAQAADQAENLLTLLLALSEADPSFNVEDFMKALDEPNISEQDLEYLLYLSNLASEREKQQEAPPRERQIPQTPSAPLAAPLSAGLMMPPIAEREPIMQEQLLDQPSAIYNLPQDYRFLVVPQDTSSKAFPPKRTQFAHILHKRRQNSQPPEPDMSKLYTIASLMAEPDDITRIAM